MMWSASLWTGSHQVGSSPCDWQSGPSGKEEHEGSCGDLLTEPDVKRVLESLGYDVVCLPVDRFPSGGVPATAAPSCDWQTFRTLKGRTRSGSGSGQTLGSVGDLSSDGGVWCQVILWKPRAETWSTSPWTSLHPVGLRMLCAL